MDYEKEYNTALKRASKLRVQNPFDTVGQMVEHIFPELKNTEDEKIRKVFVGYFKSYKEVGTVGAETFNGIPTDNIIAWLEKQGKQTNPYSGISFEYNGHIWGMCARDNGVDILLDKQLFKHLDTQGEQKPYGQRKECKDCQFNYAGECKGFCQMKRDEQKPVDEDEPKFRPGDIVQYITDSTDRRKIEEIDTLCNMYHTDSSPIMFEVEDEWKVVVNAEDVEQESANNAEPKFRPGDWIIDNEYGEVLKVTKADANSYEITNQDEEVFNFLREDIECNYHLWTIADAKDGDLIYVSTEEKGIQAIFHKFENAIIFCHCYLCADFVQGGYIPIGSVELTYPLQKTHYNRFFEKMYEAGYEWNNDKKELRKKVEPEFHEGDWLCENEPNNYARFIQILEIVNIQGKERYRISRDIHNDEDIVDFGFVEKYYHKFDISDAKDGDVLVASDGSIFIFAGVDDCACKCYVALTIGNNVETKGGYWETSRAVYPATKEQRDTLIKAMANAGYTFDFVKKELKKIMQNLAWGEKDDNKVKEIIEYLNGLYDNYRLDLQELNDYENWLKSIKQRLGSEKKPADDAKMLDANKVIAWIDEHVPTKFEDMANYVQQFKKDFGL